MLAQSSPPPDSDSTPPILNSINTNQHLLQPPSKKRKRTQAAAASPAPSDLGTNGNTNTNSNGSTDLLPTSRADLSSRPILTTSRGPTFVPVSEGSEWFRTEMIGVNRIGYRYIPAGINPPGFATPCRTIESNPTSFRISWEDRSTYLKVTRDGLNIAGSKGFRSARCNAPMREGKWYMEVKILHGGGERVGDENTSREGSHVRLGWGRRESPLNGPAGLDGYSYGYRDKNGEKFTLARPKPYGKPFKTGDVVGMYISLPPRRKPNPKDPHDPAHLHRERIPIDLKGQEVYEILEYPQSKEMAALMDYSSKSTASASLPSSKKPGSGKLPERSSGPASSAKATPPTPTLRPLPILPGSRIAFFVNGECQGTAFSDIYDYLPLRQTETQRKAKEKNKRTREGVKEHRENPFDDGTLGYYPFISLFNDASVRLNPGPDFEFPPPKDIDAVLDAMAAGIELPQPPQPTVKIQEDDIQTTLNLTGNPIEDSTVSQPPISTPETTTAPEAPPTSTPTSQPQPKNESSSSPTNGTLQPTWRPAIDRYPEFMAEEWAFDALEEEQAKSEAAKISLAIKAEEEKKKQKEKRRQQADAKRKAKKAEQEAAIAASKASSMMKMEVEGVGEDGSIRRTSSPLPGSGVGPGVPPTGVGHLATLIGPGGISFNAFASAYTNSPGGGSGGAIYHNYSANASNYPSPSPLRQTTTAYQSENENEQGHDHDDALAELEHELDQEQERYSERGLSRDHSPAPTFTSYGGDFVGGDQSGYNSEAAEQEMEVDQEMDVDQELQELLPDDPRTPA